MAKASGNLDISTGKHLLVVESPAKSKTITKYLGSHVKVLASYGHITELVKKDMGVDVDNGFEPHYEIDEKKKKAVGDLKKAMKQVDQVRIATDEDREGEAIGRHVAQELGLDVATTPRITFNEITKTALEKAVKNPRTLDMDLINAQQARRILDRLVGFQLSPLLWKKVRTGLSAGRVQSVAVRLIVDREREIQEFIPTSSLSTKALFKAGKDVFEAKANRSHASTTKAKQYFEELSTSNFVVESVESKPGTKKPSAPFTTSTLQQEASRRLGYSVGQTMRVAQKLYEAGAITYMRTDSIVMSKDAIAGASKAIAKKFGADNVHKRNFSNKSGSAQEAHEAIRPTNFDQEFAGSDAQQKKLYHLIWQRAMAAQMIDAQVEKTIIKIKPSLSTIGLTARGEVVSVPGFLQVYKDFADEDEDEDKVAEGQLPGVKVGQSLDLVSAEASTSYTRHPARYTEASLVKKLESEGIGRPSTYAPTISTIIQRGYVEIATREGALKDFKTLELHTQQSQKDSEKMGAYYFSEEASKKPYGSEKKKLFPTDTGILVTEFLIEHFSEILDYHFTAKVEEQFDEIASGERDRQKMLGSFYTPFVSLVEKSGGEDVARVSGERMLGKDPKTGKTVLVRLGRFGPLVQLGEQEDEDKTYASLKPGLRLESITLEEALDCLKLPREIGEYKGEQIKIAIGRFGPYAKYGKLFVSLGKDLDPYSVSLEEVKPLIDDKIEKEKNRIIKEFDYKGTTVSVENGRYGPFIRYGKKNIKIPAEMKKENLKKLAQKYYKEVIDKYVKG